ncbi:coiled-coil domain-containing protein R3HCC1L isoform X1 [Ixodes scapularis]
MEHDTLQSSSLSKEEQFLDTVFKEVRKFASGDVQNSLLLFPALLKRERFLTHKVVEENFENLCSFSLGENDLRRTAVCLKSRLIHALTSRQCNHEGVHRLALTLCRQQGLPVDFLSYRMKKAATNKTEAALPPRAARRQRRPDMQLYVPRGRNLEPPQRAASSCAQEDRISKRDDDQTRWNTEVKGPRPSAGEALLSQNHGAPCLSTTQMEHFDRRSTASIPAGRSCNAPKQQTTPLPGCLPEPSTDSMGCLGDRSLSKSSQPYTEAAECSSVQKKAAASGQQDVLGGANLSKSLPLGLKQGEHKGDVASKHSSVLEPSRPDSSKHLFGTVEQVQSWNSGVPTPLVSLGGMSSATDVQRVQVKSRSNETMKLPAVSESASSKGLCSAAVQAASEAGEPSKQVVLSKREGSLKDSHAVPLQKKSRSEKLSKIPAVSEGASLKDLHSVAVQTASKAEESLKPPVPSEGEGSSKDIDVVPVQAKSGSDESSNPPVVSENVSLKDVCRAVVQEGLKTEETFTLPILLEVSSSKNNLALPALANSKSDDALKPSAVLEESDSLKDSNCAMIEDKSKPDERLKPPTLSGGPHSLETLPDMPAHAESKNGEVLKSHFASERGDELADFNNLPLEENSRSDKSIKVTMSDVNDSERDIYAVPAQVKLKNDETLTPPVISGKEDTLRDLHAALVQNILETDHTLKPSIVPENASSLKNVPNLPGRARTESDDKVLDLPTGSGCTSQDFHNISEQSVFESDELSISAISEEFNTSEDICAVSEQVVAEVDVSLELPAAAGDACLCEGVKSVPERSESERHETLEPSEVTSTNGSASYSGEQDGQEHDSWDALFDESGECFDPGVLKDITQALGDIKVQYAELDYTKFEPHIPDLSEAEYGHILEIYNFPPEFETKDVVSGLSCSRDQFNIKWVDDTHVLAVFSTPFAATEALSLQTPLMKMRHISEASKQSKLKVKRCAEFLQPFKPRPQTSASVARRLVSGALGLRVQVEPEQRRRELQMLREAKGRRKTVAKQRTDAWNGDVA